jgi:hypothetical protein
MEVPEVIAGMFLGDGGNRQDPLANRLLTSDNRGNWRLPDKE